jgi:4a-hydroxytetrahydrobiopterin dehydratase
MSRPSKLSRDDIEARLEQLADWDIEDGKLHRTFEFANFVEAFGWMTQIAILAEKMDHHPEWSNVYNRIEVHLTTHDAGGLTESDFDLAAHMNRLAP